MNSTSENQSKGRPLERFLSLLAFLVCLGITIRIWQLVSPQQSMWPIPGLYFIEMVMLSGLAAAAINFSHNLPWAFTGIAFGATLAFSVLAGFSVGLFYLPVVALLLIAGFLLNISTKRSLLIYLAWATAAAVIQTGITLAAINLLYPG
jgi:hypothetical protein